MAPIGSAKIEAGVGNTRTPAAVHWCFTLNNPTEEEFEVMKNIIRLQCDDYRVQEEEGENGTPHLQGYLKFKKKARPMELFENKRIHWENARSPKHARAYCEKEESATGKYVLDTVEPLKLITPTYDWQKKILEMIKSEPDDRTINWYWEAEGGVGKSAFTKYLCAKHGAICVGGKSNDVKYGIIKYHENKKKYPKIIILDVPRTNLDYICYEAIESIKNGCFFCGKYESDMVLMNSPHMIIFANRPPDKSKLSLDRWNIVNLLIDKETLLEKEAIVRDCDTCMDI